MNWVQHWVSRLGLFCLNVEKPRLTCDAKIYVSKVCSKIWLRVMLSNSLPQWTFDLRLSWKSILTIELAYLYFSDDFFPNHTYQSRLYFLVARSRKWQNPWNTRRYDINFGRTIYFGQHGKWKVSIMTNLVMHCFGGGKMNFSSTLCLTVCGVESLFLERFNIFISLVNLSKF